MDNQQFKKDDSDFHLEVVKRMENQTVTDLEFVMTNSAFGYEYAISALDKEGDLSFGSDRLRQEVDSYKQVYFEARKKLKRIDESRLAKLEQDLTLQKMMFFSKQQYLH